MLRGDVVKDDSSSSASHMTAAKVVDVTSRLLGSAGQASGAVSAYTQIKWKTRQRYWDCQKQSAQSPGFVCHDPSVRNHGTKFRIP